MYWMDFSFSSTTKEIGGHLDVVKNIRTEPINIMLVYSVVITQFNTIGLKSIVYMLLV